MTYFFHLTQILDGTCVLSDTTGSDIGGLYSSTTAEVHYFEMKPILGKLYQPTRHANPYKNEMNRALGHLCAHIG